MFKKIVYNSMHISLWITTPVQTPAVSISRQFFRQVSTKLIHSLLKLYLVLYSRYLQITFSTQPAKILSILPHHDVLAHILTDNFPTTYCNRSHDSTPA